MAEETRETTDLYIFVGWGNGILIIAVIYIVVEKTTGLYIFRS
jgi:hypothetical protein